jgi:hypothetical protein
MANTPAHAVRQLKKNGEHPVWLVHRPGEAPRTLKTWSLTPGMCLKLVLGIAQPQRQIAGARRLERADLRTPAIPGGWRFARRGRPVVEMELVYVDGPSALEAIRDQTLPIPYRRAASVAVGRVVAQMIEARIFNRDMKLNNLILADCDGQTEVWQIDTVGVRSIRRRVKEAARMLERLALQLAFIGSRPDPAVWVPAMRHALRGLDLDDRREVVRRLKAHRRP